MSCLLGNEDTVIDAAIIGHLDPKQKLTFTLISEHGETDASELMRSHSAEEDVKQTAWNNPRRHDLTDCLSRRREGGRDSVCQGSFDLGTEGGGGSHSIRLIFAYCAMMYKWQMQ